MNRSREFTCSIELLNAGKSLTAIMWDGAPIEGDKSHGDSYQVYSSEGKYFHVIVKGGKLTNDLIISLLNRYKRGEWGKIDLRQYQLPPKVNQPKSSRSRRTSSKSKGGA